MSGLNEHGAHTFGTSQLIEGLCSNIIDVPDVLRSWRFEVVLSLTRMAAFKFRGSEAHRNGQSREISAKRNDDCSPLKNINTAEHMYKK
jgi:hypothetical protein